MKIKASLFLLIGMCTFLSASEPTLTMITDIGSSARMVSLGGIEGFGESAESIFDNPAALFRVRDRSYSLFHTQFINGEVTVLNAAVAERFQQGYLAFGVYQSSVSSIPFTGGDSVNGFNVVDRFNYDNSIYKLGYQFFWGEISIGANLTYFSESIHNDKGTGLNMDLGIIWQHQGFDWSLSGKNILGSSVVYNGDLTNNDSVLMPQQLALSTRRLFNDFSVYGQVKYYQGIKTPLKSAAVEYHVPALQIPVTASLGWREFISVGEIYSNMTFGIGMGIGNYVVNFAFEKSDFISQDQQYYLSLHFSL